MSATEANVEHGIKTTLPAYTEVASSSPLILLQKYIAFDSQGAEADAQATHGLSIAIGTRAQANGNVAIALGHVARALATDTIAIGVDCVADGHSGIMLGNHGAATLLATALGSGAKATHARSVALGSRSSTDQENTVSVGSVEQRRAIRFLADGELAASSHEAVTGRQLFATQQKVDANESAIARNAENIAAAATRIGELSDQIGSGGVGLVQQNAASRALTIGAATDGSLIEVAGTRGTRRLCGLSNGQEPTDAATLDQLDALRDDPLLARYDNATRTELTFNRGGSTTRLHNVENGVSATDAATVGQLDALRDDPLVTRYDNATRTELTFNQGGGATRLSNVENGESAADAVNRAQLDGVDGKVDQAVATMLDLFEKLQELDSTAVKFDESSATIPSHGSKITELADGTAASDAVNKGQLEGAVAALDQKLTDTVAYADAAHTLVTLNPDQAPARLTNVAAGAVENDAVNFGQLSPVLAKVRFLDISGDGDAQVLGQRAVAVGSRSTAAGNNSVAVGVNAAAQEDSDVAIGRDARAAGELTSDNYYYVGVALGRTSESASSGIALGQSSKAMARGAIAIGGSAAVQERYAVSVGQQAEAVAEGAVAVGKRAKGNAPGTVALGSDSVADEPDTVSLGNSGLKRRLVNVAVAKDTHDAVAYVQHLELKHKCDLLESMHRRSEERADALERLVGRLSARLDAYQAER